jgi:hypothetical protein
MLTDEQRSFALMASQKVFVALFNVVKKNFKNFFLCTDLCASRDAHRR